MKPDACLEVSFEAGNKVGGIYTVLVSKARFMKQIYGDNYYAIGFFSKSSIKDFEEVETPKEFKKIFEELERQGIKCFFGKWIPASDANLILLETKDFREKIVNGVRNIDLIKRDLWEKFKVDSLRAGFDYDEPLAWSIATGMLIEKIVENKIFEGNIVCHFHEWLSGGAILYLVDRKVPVATVFTTHATRIGRAKSSAGENLMEEVELGLKSGKTMSDDEAYRFGLEAQHKIEKLSAQLANVFTTVSEIVAEEAAYVLGKKPDIITINGLDLSKYPSTRTMMVLHEKFRQRINEFLTAYFSPYYPLENMKNNIIFFISGRYEFFNKGVDLFIEALAELNRRMKNSNSSKTVFAFILIPSAIKGPRQDLLESILRYEEVKDLVDESLDAVKDEIVDEIINGREPNIDKLIDESFKIKTKILSRWFKSKGEAAPLSAFDLSYENDMIMNALHKNSLNNKRDDKVKVIFYPTYISVTDGLLSMDYEEFVLGCSMGFFPSKYEPWGYTPFETAALRTLMMTTDVAGFGVELLKEYGDSSYIDKRVLKVRGRKREEIIKDMADIMEWCVELDKELRVMEKVRTRQMVEKFDWAIQISNYLKAHDLAVERMKANL